jgi:hypothetical protein
MYFCSGVEIGACNFVKSRSPYTRSGATAGALVVGIEHPASLATNPTFSDGNPAKPRKFNKIRHLVEAGGIENPDPGERGRKR